MITGTEYTWPTALTPCHDVQTMSRRELDEQVIRDRRDPRREESIPPERRNSVPADTAVDPVPGRGFGESIPVPNITALAPNSSASPREEPPRSKPEFTTTLGSGAGRPLTSGAHGHVITVADPRLSEVEPFLRAGDWDGLLKSLGTPEQAGKLPPNLGLVYAIASKEKESGHAASGKGGSPIDATDLAIRCTAGLLNVPADSALALVIAKRLVRLNPVGWQKRPAPPASVSAMIIFVALVLGGLVGWLVATGRLYVQLRLK